VQLLNEALAKHLEAVEGNLVKNI